MMTPPTITDDDATPSLSIADVSGNETAGNRQFTVTLSAAAGRDVTVNYATSDGTATAGSRLYGNQWHINHRSWRYHRYL